MEPCSRRCRLESRGGRASPTRVPGTLSPRHAPGGIRTAPEPDALTFSWKTVGGNRGLGSIAGWRTVRIPGVNARSAVSPGPGSAQVRREAVGGVTGEPAAGGGTTQAGHPPGDFVCKGRVSRHSLVRHSGRTSVEPGRFQKSGETSPGVGLAPAPQTRKCRARSPVCVSGRVTLTSSFLKPVFRI